MQTDSSFLVLFHEFKFTYTGLEWHSELSTVLVVKLNGTIRRCMCFKDKNLLSVC